MSLFNSLSDYVTETSEKMIKVVEEGTSILFQHADSDSSDSTSSPSSTTFEGTASADPMGEFEGFEEDMDESPLDGIAQGVLGDILKDNQFGPSGMLEHIEAFRSAITWKEPFIIGLISLHILLAFLAIIVIKYDSLPGTILLLVILASIVRSAERLNEYGASHWEEFATQDYFDSGGVFVSIMVSAPLLLLSFSILVHFLREAGSLMIEVKRNELKQNYRKKKSQENSNNKNSKKSKRSTSKKSSGKQD